MNTEELISLIKNFNKNAPVFVELDSTILAISQVSAENEETILKTTESDSSLKNWEIIFILNNLNQPKAPVFAEDTKKSHLQLFGMRFNDGKIYLK